MLPLPFIRTIVSGNSSITVRPKPPGYLTNLGTDYTVVSTTNSLNFSESNQKNSRNPQIPIGIVWKRVECVLGIEPNARFLRAH